jgi:hypothetical protein|tara:strand:+ start:4808 stop:5632 length:825 start_codon:yes stop_codon:yes gene_type:complete
MAINASNAHSIFTAGSLADAKPGFYGLIIRKTGVTRGPKGAKVTYGNDLVHTLFVGGISYIRLVKRSRDELAAMTPADMVALEAKGYDCWTGRGKNATQTTVTAADFIAARDAMLASFDDTISGTNSATTDHVYEPLKVLKNDGTVETVRGARVYKCVKADPNHECKCRMCLAEAGTPNNRAPVDGQINILGIKVGSTVLDAGLPIPASKSGASAVAKRVLKSRLPIKRLVSYRLEQNGDWILRAGGEAAAAAGTDGVTCDEAAIKVVEVNLVA